MNSPLELERLDIHQPVADLGGFVAVEYADGRVMIVELEPQKSKVTGLPAQVGVKAWRRGRLTPMSFWVGPTSEIGDVALLMTFSQDVAGAYRLPDGVVVGEFNTGLAFAALGATLAAGGLGAGVMALANVAFDKVLAWIVIIAFAVTALVLVLRRGRLQSNHFRVGGERFPMQQLVRHGPTRRAARRQVEDVKAEYGKLVSDVVHRIEYPALFDATEPNARRFTELIVQWDNTHAELENPELLALAGQIRVAFDTARAHAERVGMQHLPEAARGPAATAAQALRLARDPGASAAERRTALQKANDILRSLMLHYLPTPHDVEALVAGKRPKALPGRLEELR